MAFALPPWLNVEPSFFSQALEAGARTGLGLADARLRAETLAAAQAERQSRDQERADQAAERAAEFDATRLLNMQKLAQDAAQLQQQTAHQSALEAAQAAQESRLLNYQTGQLGLGQERNRITDLANASRLAQAQNALDLRAKHYGELEKHNQAVLDLQTEKANKEKEPTVTKNIFAPGNEFMQIGSIRGTLNQLGMPGAGTGKPLSREQATEFLRQADGDKDKARKLARDAGYTF
jgi:hypothetical protein